MNYRSYGDLANSCRHGIQKIESEYDAILGIPRSGVVPATMIALHLNANYASIGEFKEDKVFSHGVTRSTARDNKERPSQCRNVLLVDDSALSGNSIRQAKDEIRDRYPWMNVTTLSVYVTKKSRSCVDIWFEVVEVPRTFEWNLFHREYAANWCFDIDGVLCVDPTDVENDDSRLYKNFLSNASQLARPTVKLGFLVTSRLEKYRKDTEKWLKDRNIEYEELFMIDVDTAKERRKLGLHSKFKSEVYKKVKASNLFIESDKTQAQEIANDSGKAVLCFSNQVVYYPRSSIQFSARKLEGILTRVLRRARVILIRFIK